MVKFTFWETVYILRYTCFEYQYNLPHYNGVHNFFDSSVLSNCHALVYTTAHLLYVFLWLLLEWLGYIIVWLVVTKQRRSLDSIDLLEGLEMIPYTLNAKTL